VPLPQPLPAPEVEYRPTFSALPQWLAKPTVISSKTRVPFSSLNIHPKLLQQIENKGFKDAFAVQSAIIPLLLPGPQHHFGDVCVSAATGSGKTLGYVLPIIQSLRGSVVTKLRCLIIVPTRELVGQVREVAEQCAVGTGIKIGTALGSRSLHLEQSLLVNTTNFYNPAGYERLQAKGREELRSGGPRNEQLLGDCLHVLPGHVPSFSSNVDILICTPGRLVDHIKSTRGFSLKDTEWLVIDEADRLLDQSFQQWAATVVHEIESNRTPAELSAYDQIVRNLGYPEARKGITKIILSATMTRDLAKLSSLKLSRPKLIIVQDETALEIRYPGDAAEEPVDRAEVYDLPATLHEFAIPVGDGSEKALILLDLLRTRIMKEKGPDASKPGLHALTNTRRQRAAVSITASSIESDSLSESSQASDASSSDGTVSEHFDQEADRDARYTPPNTAKSLAAEQTAKVLIFTKDNENASRLSHLLGILHPAYAKTIGTLTKSSTSTVGRKVLAAFRRGKTSILVASDRASRGLDVPDLTHVINYDIPRSITAYIHRVGRTARAGKKGEAWTLFTNSEGKWFWNTIAKAPKMNRGKKKVERVRPDRSAINDGMRSAYEAALKQLQLVVEGNASEAHQP
jgi:ATP-dependent RNA helicase DDX51/DBP6